MNLEDSLLFKMHMIFLIEILFMRDEDTNIEDEDEL